MTVADWLTRAREDALQRKLPELVPLLEGLATSTEALRRAAWNDDAEGGRGRVSPDQPMPAPER